MILIFSFYLMSALLNTAILHGFSVFIHKSADTNPNDASMQVFRNMYVNKIERKKLVFLPIFLPLINWIASIYFIYRLYQTFLMPGNDE